MSDFEVRRITSTAKTEITTTNSDFRSIVFTNNHASAALTIDLWVTEQLGNDIEDTSNNVNNGVGYAAGTSSTAIAVDGATFTDATCDYNNDPTIAHDDDDGAIKVGMVVSGTGIPTGSTVASVTSDTSFELSASTTGGSVTNGTLTFLPNDILNEKVWKSDGTLVGTCTALASTTSITFGDGLSQKLVDNDDLYIGIDHFFLNNIVIPFGTSLKLEENEFSFSPDLYKMWITCTTCSTTNTLDITIRR